MYIPNQNKHENISDVKDFLANNSFGILISQVDQKPWATHIPLELAIDENGKDVLVGHIAKANEQWKSFEENKEVLCVFNGPHSYISSSWYKKMDVPTWNYIAVHIYGTIKIMDEKATLAAMSRLVDKYEQGSEKPVSLKNMSEQTLRQVHGVVGFQIEITDIQAKYKLSKNRKHDHSRIVEELEKSNDSGSLEIAKLMQTHKPKT